MKKGLLKYLVCPGCKNKLTLKEFSYDLKGKEIEEGYLGCKKCSAIFPIINGIPRMLPFNVINSNILTDFLEKHASKIPEYSKDNDAGFEILKKRTSESFGFQWNVFSYMFEEYEKNFLNYIKPLKPSFFKKKIVLDAGCGFGRHTYYAAKYGAEVIGFDLSDAVDAAKENCKEFDRVHIVQGDIYNLPFGKSFDFIMSIGVLHHLPNPQRGFMKLVELLKSGDEIFAWLYGREGRAFKTVVLEGSIRKVTVSLPRQLLYYFCYLPASLYHGTNLMYHLFNSNRLTRGIAGILPFKNYAKFPFKVKHADAYDFLGTPVNNYYSKEDCKRWAENARLRNVKITDISGRSWRIFGKK